MLFRAPSALWKLKIMARVRTFKERNFLLVVFYEGPWERLESLCMGHRRDPNAPLRWEIPEKPKGWKWVLNKIACWAEQRDAIWRAKYAIKRKVPHKRWSRLTSDERTKARSRGLGMARSRRTGNCRGYHGQ